MPYNKIYKYLGSNRKKPTSSIYKERKKLLKLKKISPKESPKDSSINFNVTNVFENVEIDVDDDNLDIDMNMNNSFEQTKETLQLCEIDELLPIINDDLSIEEICAALVGMFYSGKLTQMCFKMVLDFLKITYSLKLPANFNKCAKIILESNNDEISFTKTWYCGICGELFEKLKRRFDRTCVVCKTKYKFVKKKKKKS
jgi:hypothetical protein